MRWALATIAVIGLTLAAPALTKPHPAPDYGPAPDWAAYRHLAEAAVMGRLFDPESARFTWSYGYHKGGVHPAFSSWINGYIACGQVNARNRMGGYTGFADFLIAIDHDAVLYLDIDKEPGGLVQASCQRQRTEGLYQPLAVPIIAAAPRTEASPIPVEAAGIPTVSHFGLSLRAMPDGAYVSAVAGGSLAATAGLKPGMVIASVNGIALAGMGDAMLKVVDAAGPSATLSIIGGAPVRLGGRQ